MSIAPKHSLVVAVLVMAMGAVSCSPDPAATPPATVETPAPPVPLTDAARARLAEADAADGQVDQVVSKCVTCALAMQGKPIHAVTVEGYTFHLCAAGCKTMFAKDPAKALLALKLTELPVE